MSQILLIEPDRVIARTYVKALKHAGHTVTSMQGAQQALNAAEERRPDVVVLELQLSSHNGVEFLHEFRSYGEWYKIPVIVNTHIPPQAIATVEAALRNDLGVRAILYKPRTSLAQLVRTVNEQLSEPVDTLDKFDRPEAQL